MQLWCHCATLSKNTANQLLHLPSALFFSPFLAFSSSLRSVLTVPLDASLASLMARLRSAGRQSHT